MQRTREGFDQARRYFFEAIEIDSTFAPAYAGLAEAYGSAAFFGLGRPSQVMPRVKTLAEAALRHDSTLAGAVERGSELGRMVPFSTFRPVAVLNYMRDFDRAVQRTEEGLRFFPNFWQGHWLLCEALAGQGLLAEAIAACEEATRLSDRLPSPLGTLGYVYARAGRRADAQRVVAELEDRADAAYVGGSDLAAVYGALGDLDRAFQRLERAYEERDVSLVHLDDHVWFDPLRSDPRFDVLLERIGLEPR